MSAAEIKPGVYWVGALDWNIRQFHGPSFTTPRGTTYNAYLIVDDEVTLVDTVHEPFTDVLLDHIAEIVDPASINNVIVNHIEMDHSGAFPAIMRLNPTAQVYATKNGRDGLLKHYTGDWDIQTVKTGDTLNIGRRTLQFVEAPMLHWPDSMFTFIPEDKLLLPNDAFGQHLATNKRFDDEVERRILMDEAAKYFANILNPFSKLILRKLQEIDKLGLDIDMIAPSHGVIYRSDPQAIIDAYQQWASGTSRLKVVIAFETMWNSTAKLAHALLEGVTDAGVDGSIHQISRSDINTIATEIMEAGAVFIGSSTINNDILPSVAPLLDEIVGLKLGGKQALAFGSQGWAGGAVKTISSKLETAGMELAHEGYSIKWVPTDEELAEARKLGYTIASSLIEPQKDE